MTPEFSRPFNVDRLNVGQPRTETVTANEAERAALAVRFGLLDIAALSASMTLSREPDAPAVVVAEGRVQAQVTQACVVTLEPIPVVVDEPFETHMAKPDYVEKWMAEHPDDDLDAPEVIEHSHIDLGEIAAQYMALALDPYPRKEGVPAPADEGDAAVAGKASPFAVLAKLKGKE